jgi:hypothetical protein
MVFNATFNNIPAITWQSVLLVEETGVPGEILQPTITNFQKEKKTEKNIVPLSGQDRNYI